MSLESFFTSIFGSKASRDEKRYRSYVDAQINTLGESMAAKSNDELRQAVADIRADIHGAIAPAEQEIADLKAKIETLPLDERQPLWENVDKLEKGINETLEHKLEEHMPAVFAALRETAARFARNETVTVTANELDRDLAGRGQRLRDHRRRQGHI